MGKFDDIKNRNKINKWEFQWIPQAGPSFPGRIVIWNFYFLRRELNRSIRRKTLGAGTRTNNKLNLHMTPNPGIEPGSHWWEASALTTALSLLPFILPKA